MHPLIQRLKDMYSEFPFPAPEEYRQCIRSYKYMVYESPLVEFCEYAYSRQLSWFDCSWEEGILPLEEDTTILSHYTFALPFLRYYLPTCLHIAVRYFQGAYAGKDVGNVRLFVKNALCSMGLRVQCGFHEEAERAWLEDCSLLVKNNEFYDGAAQYDFLRRALEGSL